MVYVSCNPSTLAKDIQVLSTKFKVEYIQPVDMFPHTAHVGDGCTAGVKIIIETLENAGLTAFSRVVFMLGIGM